MDKLQIVLILVFVIAAIVGYFIINRVPSLLHTPLMSGMNALSGVTILGALLSTAAAKEASSPLWGYVFGIFAIILAMINVSGGFIVTNRMLKMFTKQDKKND